MVFHAVLLLCRICLFPVVGTYFWMDIVAALSDGNVDSQFGSDSAAAA